MACFFGKTKKGIAMINTFLKKKNLVINQTKYGYTNIVNFTITQLLLIFGFFLFPTFTVHMTAGKGGRHLFNSSLPLPPTSEAFRDCPGDYCRGLTSAMLTAGLALETFGFRAQVPNH